MHKRHGLVAIGLLLSVFIGSSANAQAPIKETECWKKEPIHKVSRGAVKPAIKTPAPTRYGYRVIKVLRNPEAMARSYRWRYACLLHPVPELMTVIVFDGLPPAIGSVPLENTTGNITVLDKDVPIPPEFNAGIFVKEGPGGMLGPITRPNNPPTIPTPVTGVPEPSTWALLITGFGIVGGLLRRKRFRNA